MALLINLNVDSLHLLLRSVFWKEILVLITCLYYIVGALKPTVPLIWAVTHRHDFLFCFTSDQFSHYKSSCMVITGLYLTLVTVTGPDLNSLTWLPGLTLDIPHHCGGELDCWVDLVTTTEPCLLTLLGYGGTACPSDGEPFHLPALLLCLAPGFSSLAEHRATAPPWQALHGAPIVCLSTVGILTSHINKW